MPQARWTIPHLVDLEHRLHADADEPVERKDERDARIGRAIDAPALDDQQALIRWVDGLREQTRDTPGQRFGRWRETTGALLAVVGLLLGGGAVWGWLVVEHGKPINVIHFWAALVGIQLLLLLLWLGAIVPHAWVRRIPGVSGLHELMRGVAALLPRAAVALSRRFNPQRHAELAAGWGRVRQMHWLYGRVQFWLFVGMTQAFAVAFNVGALAALWIAATVADPSFGWRSTLLDESAVHRAATAVAAPWNWAWPDAVPTLDEVRATRYRSLDERFVGGGADAAAADDEVWASWFGFLVASLACYGLLLRSLAWGVCRWRLHAALGGLRVEHEDARRLLGRMRRSVMRTQAPEADPDIAAAGASPDAPPLNADGVDVDRCVVLAWAGVELDDAQLTRRVRDRLGGDVLGVHRVGALDVAQDAVALDAVRDTDHDVAVALVVESWEPPIGDYVDYIGAIRAAVGEGRAVVVLLYGADEQRRPAPPSANDAHQWRRRLAALGDPWLRVEPMLGEAPA